MLTKIIGKIFGDDDDNAAQQQAFIQQKKSAKKQAGLSMYKDAIKRAASPHKQDPRVPLAGFKFRDLDFTVPMKQHLKKRAMLTKDTKRRVHNEISKDYQNLFARIEQDPVGQLIAFENLNRTFSIPDDDV